jgi:hypothetical protein
MGSSEVAWSVFAAVAAPLTRACSDRHAAIIESIGESRERSIHGSTPNHARVTWIDREPVR